MDAMPEELRKDLEQIDDPVVRAICELALNKARAELRNNTNGETVKRIVADDVQKKLVALVEKQGRKSR